MFSLNVPLPPAIDRIAADLHPKLTGFDRVRERHTLVAKRVDARDVPGTGGGPHPGSKDVALAALREELRPLLAGTTPFTVTVDGLGTFERPAAGPGPVVYLSVESDALRRLHRRLCASFDPVDGIEGDDYIPHITLARGGSAAAVESLLDTPFDTVSWRVHEFELYDPEFREVAGRVRP
ncbi:2'-5' RNA ligase family protein [Halorubrum vacuolatum]|uniref:2'-5' RNA ligase superfamily protein n=1 Tax=Halorubrum vacuolatum TaxID=63740 RepID=A0A238XWG4_HALVU|nr:2'-5' RNA ligase family protein [Halorubrum vacuolatum]SNR62783.1 2'-5' RNA ligase superfamily protein [Halorubrum vacuolatum]